MPGRPKKKRTRAAHEPGVKVSGKLSRISRHGVVMTCQRCQQTGHNKKGCKNEPKPKPARVPKKMGRPRKTNASTNSDQVGPSTGGNVGGSPENVGASTGGNVCGSSENVGASTGVKAGGFSSQNQTARWTKKRLFDEVEKLSPKKFSHFKPAHNFVIGSCSATMNTCVAFGVSSAGFKNPNLYGVKGPRRLPSWWGAGVCVDPKTGETFVGGSDGVPVPAWPPEVPLRGANEMTKRQSPRLKARSVNEEGTPDQGNAIQSQPDVGDIMKRMKRKGSQPDQVVKRKPSERIINKKLSASIAGPGDSLGNAMDI